MFKTKLHEYCHSKAWLLPEFAVEREGPDHCARFKAVVLVNGNSFTSPHFSRSIKEAHNLAAKLAYEHFVGCSNLGMPETISPSSRTVQLSKIQGAPSTSSTGAKDSNIPKDSTDKGNMYKNQLQAYAQKRKIELPVYSTERKGPIHQSLFKSNVTVEGQTYESGEFFHTLRKAEAAAAKVALAKLIPEGIQEDDLSIYKNLLQEYLRDGLTCIPKYTTVQAGPPHMPIFFPTVEIRGETFKGEPAITKKQAELAVAKVAYIALRDRGLKQDDSLNFVEPTTQVMKTPQVAKIATSDAQFISGKQIEFVEDKGMEAIPNHVTGIPGPTSNCGSGETLVASSLDCSSSPPLNQARPSHSDEPRDDEAKKKKMKITVMKLGTTSPMELNTPQGPDPSVHILHSDEKWIAVTGKSD